MPGYVIHLAIAKVYEKYNNINNISEFERGVIAPDMSSDKSKSHYGLHSSEPNLKEFVRLNRDLDEYTEGYFLHLLTDYLFYNRFLKEWDTRIYDDYNKLNNSIIKKYGIIIPPEIDAIVEYKSGQTEIIEEEKLFRFIDSIGKINIREIFIKEKSNCELESLLEY